MKYLKLEKEVSDATRLLISIGIEEIIFIPTGELDNNARPILCVSYKQFDLLTKKNNGEELK